MRWVEQSFRLAADTLAEPVMEYFRQGAGAGVAAAEATQVWDSFRLRPKVLRNVSAVDTGTTLLGHAVSSPVAVAPTTLRRAAHPDGEVDMATGAKDAGALLCVSSNAGTRFDRIGAAAGPWWLQVYLPRERAQCLPLIRRACDAGAGAIVLTVDTPVVGVKACAGPSVWDVVDPGMLLANLDATGMPETEVAKADDLTVDDIALLRDATGLPVIVKGVLRGDDAAACVGAGAAAVWVSNHGGRQLDLAVPTARALPEVVSAVAGQAEVYVDGGLRRGEHVLSALAMGAHAVFLGRPPLYGLAADGHGGVRRVLEELTVELAHAMTLAGVPDLPSITPDLVTRP